MFELVNRANMNDINVVTHADGARLNRRLISLYIEVKEKYPNAGNRLDHLTTIASVDRQRIIDNRIPANITPGFVNDADSGPDGVELYKVFKKDYADDV